ncbi:MAG: DUF2252 family protein [Myxococcota bacterium]|nr:DUF2252 family protein [Myxococcota bacterium]
MIKCFQLFILMWIAGCVPMTDREARIFSQIVNSDAQMLCNRRLALEEKYQKMSRNPYRFLRGTFGLFLQDQLDRPQNLPILGEALGIGDTHPENYTMAPRSDGRYTMEFGDLDAFQFHPAEWELLRLAQGGLVAIYQNVSWDQGSAEAIVEAMAEGYVIGLEPSRVPDPSPSGGNLFRAWREKAESKANRRIALRTYVNLTNGMLRRGTVDGSKRLLPLPPETLDSLRNALKLYEVNARSKPPVGATSLRDAGLLLGRGVSSLPLVRLMVLVEGDSPNQGDEWLLEFKELRDPFPLSETDRLLPYTNAEERLQTAFSTLWPHEAIAPNWGSTVFMGVPMQVRQIEGGLMDADADWFAEDSDEAKGLLARLAHRLGLSHRSQGLEASPGLRKLLKPQLVAAATRSAKQSFEDYKHYTNLLQKGLFPSQVDHCEDHRPGLLEAMLSNRYRRGQSP